MNVSSCLCFWTFLIQHVYLMVSYKLQLCFACSHVFFVFLHSCVNVLACVAIVCVCSVPACVCVCSGSVTRPSIGHAVGRRQSVDSPRGHAALEAESGACHPNHQPPPPSSVDRPTPCSPCSPFPGPQCLGCGLWMSATSWLSAQGLAGDWPVVEVQYQALSVSSSFHFLPPLSAGWAVVSGTNIL